MPIDRYFKLYLNAGRSIPLVINANQYDSGETWYFTLYTDRGEVYLPSSGAIIGIKADGHVIDNAATVDSRGRVVVTETEQMTAAPGKSVFELSIDGNTHGTANFMLLVEPKPSDGGILSDSDLSLLQQAIDSTSPEAIAQGVSDWMDEHLAPGEWVIDDTLTVQGAAADAKKTGDEIAYLKSAIEQVSSLTSAIKSALLQLAQKVAYIDENGQDYYDDLYDALYPPIVVTAITLSANSLSFGTLNATQQLTATTTPVGGAVTWSSSDTSVATVSQTGVVTSVAYGNATITATSGNVSATCSVTIAQATVTSISAVYTQSGTVYDTDSLDSLKSDLVVTATWSNQTTSTVASADYTLSGTLTTGTSTITVSYGGKTTTFTVTVTSLPYIAEGLVHYWDAIDNTGNGHDSSATVWKDLIGSCDLTKNDGVTTTSWDANALVFAPTASSTKQAWQNTDGITDSTNMTVEVIMTPASNVGNSMVASFVSYANTLNKRVAMSANDLSCMVFSADPSGSYLTGLTSLADVRSIVGTYTSTSGSSGCYVNGVEKTSRASHTYNGTLTGTVIGSYNNSTSTYPYKGKIHAIRVYNRVLTAEEIQTNYQKAIAYYGLE